MTPRLHDEIDAAIEREKRRGRRRRRRRKKAPRDIRVAVEIMT